MATITANGSKGHHKFTLVVTETGTSTANNTSALTYEFKISPIQTGWDWASWGSKIAYSFTINGTKYEGTIPDYNGSSTVTLKSGTQTVIHEADGTKEISISFSVTDGAGKSYTPGKASASGTMALTTIPRAATLLTASNFSDGQNPTITYSNTAGEAATSLEAGIFNDVGGTAYVPYRAISKTGSSYTFPLTDAERKNLLNAVKSGNSVPVNFYVRTVIAGVTYVSEPIKRTFSVGDANPIVTASVRDINAETIRLTGDDKKLIKYHSHAEATMTATPQKGASIDESLYIIRNGSNTIYYENHTFHYVQSNDFEFYATDSRGNVGSAFLTPTMVDYIKPTCNLSNNKPDADGDMVVACSGNYFNDTFGAVENTLTVQYRYKEYGGSYSDWIDMTSITKSGNWYTASASLSGLDYQKTYTFEARARDILGDARSTWSAKSMPLFHWGANDVVFEAPVIFKQGFSGALEGDQQITGDLRLKGDGNYGNYLRFGDGSYCYIAELEDDIMTIRAAAIQLNAVGGVVVNGFQLPLIDEGTWTPELNSNAISSYTTQEGWYSKVGQTVSVGFIIKANCNSGYDSTGISIFGLPFTPMYATAGGGMCSGANVSGGYTFQCYVADTNGSITTRVQACNNETGTNLVTSAGGCKYRTGGGEITLSGTITYMTSI